MKATVKCRMDAIQNPDVDKVLISISSAGYKYDPVPHNDDWFDILHLAFDDVLPDHLLIDPRIKEVPMTMDHAQQIYEFINKYMGKDFVIHCDAGISRSTAVGSYMEKYYDYDIVWDGTGDSKDTFKNIHVFNLLGRINYHSAFGDIDV